MAENEEFEFSYFCPECGRSFPDDSTKYCEKCGAQITRKMMAKNNDTLFESAPDDNNERYFLVDVISGERYTVPCGISELGRAESSFIPISEECCQVSRVHANIICEKGKPLRLEDRNSSNGTYVNDKRADGSTVLEPGNIIILGSDEYKKFKFLRLEKEEK